MLATIVNNSDVQEVYLAQHVNRILKDLGQQICSVCDGVGRDMESTEVYAVMVPKGMDHLRRPVCATCQGRGYVKYIPLDTNL